MVFRKIVPWLAAVLLLALSAQGCHTIRGAGQDIEEGGEEIQDVTQ